MCLLANTENGVGLDFQFARLPGASQALAVRQLKESISSPTRQATDSTLGDEDRGTHLAAQFLKVPHRALDCFLLRRTRELGQCFLKRLGLDFEADGSAPTVVRSWASPT
jgi:hypothetical protein